MAWGRRVVGGELLQFGVDVTFSLWVPVVMTAQPAEAEGRSRPL